MVQVRRYTKKDGTEVRRHTRSAPGKGGGPSGSVGVLVAVVLSLAALGTGENVLAPGSARQDERPTWRHGGSVFTVVDSEESGSCAGRSYGRVVDFFTEHPCRKLRRALLTVPDGSGETMLVAVSRTTMPSTGAAKRLRELLDTPGTGNLAELSRDSPSWPEAEFTGTYYASAREGATVTVAEATPGSDRDVPEPSALHEAARTALLRPGRWGRSGQRGGARW
ncbi:hypothetical protein CDG81_18795 [Actinopolyspora erythraea]|uniref:Uncharacterized protein n=1 Tax=Actinopolyspora erythraea TaxID=414996 RepID=A0A223RVS1_9ACTN|nr:hypothetical protein [Actinopolyspora erythraea]ASU79971.1 hypothetical protein CDG81_18795 [Actinopolyspora erythraea]